MREEAEIKLEGRCRGENKLCGGPNSQVCFISTSLLLPSAPFFAPSLAPTIFPLLPTSPSPCSLLCPPAPLCSNHLPPLLFPPSPTPWSLLLPTLAPSCSLPFCSHHLPLLGPSCSLPFKALAPTISLPTISIRF